MTKLQMIQKMLPKHYAILDHFLDGVLNIKEIAAAVNMTPASVQNIRRGATFQHELAKRQLERNKLKDVQAVETHVDTTRNLIQENTEFAAEQIVDLLTSEDKAIKLKAAETILDRGGYPKVQKQESDSRTAVVVLDSDDVNRIRETFSLDK